MIRTHIKTMKDNTPSQTSPLDKIGLIRFATTPEYAFSLIVMALLVNVLGSQTSLNPYYLILSSAYILVYTGTLVLFLIAKRAKLDGASTDAFNRHVFHTAVWTGLSFPIIWADFLYPHLYSDAGLASFSPPIIEVKHWFELVTISPLVLLLYCKVLTGLRVSALDELRRVSRNFMGLVFELVVTLPFVFYLIPRVAGIVSVVPQLGFLIVGYPFFCLWLSSLRFKPPKS
jgi:hypothetical protein